MMTLQNLYLGAAGGVVLYFAIQWAVALAAELHQ